jgi:hypothetical protein
MYLERTFPLVFAGMLIVESYSYFLRVYLKFWSIDFPDQYAVIPRNIKEIVQYDSRMELHTHMRYGGGSCANRPSS